MPNQDYDINPKQTEPPKSPNRINPALRPHLPNLPRAIVGGNSENVAPQINAHPQNVQLSMEDIKRMIEVNYMMRNYVEEIPTYPNNLLSPYYLKDYIKATNVSVYTKNTLLALGEYVKNSINKQPRRVDIIDFLAKTVVSHNDRFPDVPMDEKDVVSLISDVEYFFSWAFENHLYDDVARNIYYDDVMNKVNKITVKPDAPLQVQTKTVVSTPSQADIQPIAVSPQQVNAQPAEKNMEQLALQALAQVAQQDNVPHESENMERIALQALAQIGQQDSVPHESENMEQLTLQALAQVVQQDNVPHESENIERIALQALAQIGQQDNISPEINIQPQVNEQPVFNSACIEAYIAHRQDKNKDIADSSILILRSQIKALTDQLAGRPPKPNDILDIFILNDFRENSIKTSLTVYKDLFNWLSTQNARDENIYYPNIIGTMPDQNVVLPVVSQLMRLYDQQQINAPCPTAQYFKEFEDDLLKYNDGTRARTLGFFIEFLQDKFNTNKNSQQINELLAEEDSEQEEAQELVQDGQLVFKVYWFKKYLRYLQEQPKKLAPGTLKAFENHLITLRKYLKGKPPEPSDILNILVSEPLRVTTMKTYLATYREFFRWTSSKDAKNENRYYPNIIGIMPVAINVSRFVSEFKKRYTSQTDIPQLIARYFEEFENDLLQNNDGGTRAKNFECFVEFLKEKLHINTDQQENDAQQANILYFADIQQEEQQPEEDLGQQEDEQFAFNSDWFDTYINYIKKQKKSVSRSTVDSIKSSLKLLKDYLGGSPPNPSNILDFFISKKLREDTIKTHLGTYKNFFKWTSSQRARDENRYYPKVIGISSEVQSIAQVASELGKVYDQQRDGEHPTAKYFKAFKADLRRHNDGTRALTLEYFVVFLQDNLLLNRDPQQDNAQLMAGAQQQANGQFAFNSDWFDTYINYRLNIEQNMPGYRRRNITRALNYLKKHLGKRKPKPSDILDVFIIKDFSAPIIKADMQTYREFFRWTSSKDAENENRYYPNIIGVLPGAINVSRFVSEFNKRYNSKAGKPQLTAQYFEEFKNDINQNNDGTKANNLSYFLEFLKKKLNINDDPQEEILQPEPEPEGQNEQPLFNADWFKQYTEYLKNQPSKPTDSTMQNIVTHLNALNRCLCGRSPTPSHIVDVLVIRRIREGNVKNYLATYTNFFNWTSTQNARDENRYYPNIIGFLQEGTVIEPYISQLIKLYRLQQLDTAHPTAQYFEEFQADLKQRNDGTRALTLGFFFKFLQDKLNSNGNPPQDNVQPEAEVLQRSNETAVFSSDWFEPYLKYCKKQRRNQQGKKKCITNKTIDGFNTTLNMLAQQLQGRQPNPNDIVDCLLLSHEVIPKTISNYLAVFRDFFDWTSTQSARDEHRYYPNIVGLLPEQGNVAQFIFQLKETYRSTAEYFKEFKDDIDKNNDGTKANNLDYFIKFLQDRVNINEDVQEENVQLDEEVPQQDNVQLDEEAPQQDNVQLDEEAPQQDNVQLDKEAPRQENEESIPAISDKILEESVVAQDDQQNDVQPAEKRQPTKKSDRRKTSKLTKKSVPTSRPTKVPRQINTTPPVGTTLRRRKRATAKTLPVGNTTQQPVAENTQQNNIQPVANVQQPIQDSLLEPGFFKNYSKSHKETSSQARAYIIAFRNYINNMFQGKATRECVVEWIVRNILFRNQHEPDNPMSDDKIQELISCIKDFFSWAEQKRIHNNIVSDVSIDEIKNKVADLQGTQKPSEKRPTTANPPMQQAEGQPVVDAQQQEEVQTVQPAAENAEQMASQMLAQDTQPIAETQLQAGEQQVAIQEFVQDVQFLANVQQQEEVQTVHPATEILQPTQNGILTSQHFEDYINSGALPKHTQRLIHGLKDYIINNGFSEKATKDHIVYWIGCDVAYTCLRYPKRAISNDLIQWRIDQVKAFFSWTSENHIYNNIANDISIDSIKKIADELIMNPSVIRRIKEQIRAESAVQQPITANAPRQQPAFLRMPPPVINIPMQPTPGNRQPIQNNILTPQHFKDYIDLHYLPLRNRYSILQLGIYITETSSGQATRETIIYWIGEDLAQNIYANEPISDDQIQELIDYITAFFNWAAENHIYNNNIASNISIEDIKHKAYEILNNHSFTQAFAKVHVGKPRR